MKSRILVRTALAALLLCASIQVTQAGRLRRLIYYNYPGGWVTNLFTTNVLGTVTYPDLPDTADYMPPLDIGSGSVLPPYLAATTTNLADTYGGLLQGYLTAPETGTY